jgi:DNA polymerase-3 subunit epsilon
MNLKLTRPLVFFDLETTGLDIIKDHILELSYIKLQPDGSEKAETFRFRPVSALGNVVPIPADSTAVHGIHDEDVADCPSFAEKAAELYKDVFEGADLAGFNSNKFDVPMLVEKFLNAGISYDLKDVRLIDVQTIYHKLEKRNLEAAYRFYCGKELDNAHSADADTRATFEVMKAQLDHYPDELKNDVEFLSEYSSHTKNLDLAGRVALNDENKEIFTFGKHKNKTVEEIVKKDPGFFGWLMRGDFPLNTKQVVKRLEMKYRGR